MTNTATQPSKDLVRLAPELDRLARLGRWLAAAESPSPTEEERAAAAALRLAYAESLELPLLAATEISIIKGNITVSAQLLRALAAREGYRVERVESTDDTCTARLWLEGEPVGETTFTIADAKRAGLIRDRSNWISYPARMLWARASAFVIKDFAPSVALGVITEEEAQEIAYSREVETSVRAPIVLGPEVADPQPEPSPPVGPLEPDKGYPYSGLDPPDEEPPQDQLHVEQPVGSSFQPPADATQDRTSLLPVTKPQVGKIWALLDKLEKTGKPVYEKDSMRAQIGIEYGTEDPAELHRWQARELIDRLIKACQKEGLET